VISGTRRRHDCDPLGAPRPACQRSTIVQFLQSPAGCSDPNTCLLAKKLCDITIFPHGPDRALFLSMNSTGASTGTDTVLGSITWRKIGNRWAATIHSSEGFITIESNSEKAAIDYAMVASFLLAPLVD
jgi:hypothetical protein